MKISSSTLAALAAISSCSAFHSPVGRHPLRLRHSSGHDQVHHHPSASVSPRGDVSVGLFRDLLKKITGDSDDDDMDKKSADKASSADQYLDSLDEKSSGTADDAESAPQEVMEAKVDEPPAQAVVEVEVEAAKSGTTDDTESAPPEVMEAKVDEPPAQAVVEVEVEAAKSGTTDDTESAPPEVMEAKVEEPPAPAVVEAAKEVKVVKKEEQSPLEQAEKLRAQAARIRLEADKRQVELTLEKIATLNSKLEKIKAKPNVNDADRNALEEELKALKSKLITDEQSGEIKAAPVAAAAAVTKSESADTSTPSSTTQSQTAPSVESRPALSAEEMKERVDNFQNAPEFMKVLVARTVGLGVDGDTPGAVDRLNATDIVQKLYEDQLDYQKISVQSDFTNEYEKERARDMIQRAYDKSDDDSDNRRFTEDEIQAKIEELDQLPQFIKNIVDKDFNDTEVAIMLLEDDLKEKGKGGGGGFFSLFGGKEDETVGEIGRDGERMDKDSGTFMDDFFKDVKDEPESNLSFMMESLYPKSTRKEDEEPDKKLVDLFLNDVVNPTNGFIPSAGPLSVPGGYIIRGANKCKSGEELIEKLDRRIANDARLREKISFYVLNDPFPNPEEQMLDPLNWPQVLFVAGPDVAREQQLILRTVISSFGIATAWYGSIYPFLANPKLMDRATESMALADAGMPTDLSWLSEFSIPLFLSFMALQLTHEAAHLAVARTRGFEVNIPTIVPSIMSGITGAITSLKTSPKNKQDLIDFAVAGPLVGMIGSILMLCYGLVLTATADAATVQQFPGLPLAILRQSSLGGGLIDLFLGNGALNVPASAEAAQVLASTLIALHPLAVAGFFSLLVNALALVPAGRTDGGRISMALFGRSGSQAVTFASLASLAILGFTGSDLLLFYFAFITFFQSELEIPCRNEVDEVDFSRVLLASFGGFLMLLTLIPMS